MLVQVENIPMVGYVTGVYCQLPGDNIPHWYRLRNFGDHQGDAIEMREIDIPQMEMSRIQGLIKTYDPSRIYRRVGVGRYLLAGRIGEEDQRKYDPISWCRKFVAVQQRRPKGPFDPDGEADLRPDDVQCR